MKKCLWAVMAVMVILMSLTACSNNDPATVVKGFLDAQIKGESAAKYGSPSVLKEVSEFVVKAYEVKNISGNNVSVAITFQSQADTDLQKTKIFTVENNVITAIR